MSIAGSAGASTAAGEILEFVRQEIEENENRPEILAVLRKIEQRAKEIKDSADCGWY